LSLIRLTTAKIYKQLKKEPDKFEISLLLWYILLISIIDLNGLFYLSCLMKLL